MKTFVINLKRCEQKRQLIEEECRKNNIDFEIIEAVDGAHLTNYELSRLVYKYELNYLTPGEIGCVLSHQKIYRKMVQEDIKGALILEDDAIFCENANITALLHDLSTITKKNIVVLLQKTTEGVYKNKKIKINDGYSAYEARNASLAHGYFITRDVAKTLLKVNSPIIKTADAWLSFYLLSYLKVFSLDKDVVVSRDAEKTHSSIEKSRLCKTERQERALNNVIRERKRYHIIRTYHKYLRRPLLKVVSIENI